MGRQSPWTYVEETGWDEVTLRDTFINSMSEQDQLAFCYEHQDLNDLISLPIRIDNLLHQKPREKYYISQWPQVPSLHPSPVVS